MVRERQRRGTRAPLARSGPVEVEERAGWSCPAGSFPAPSARARRAVHRSGGGPALVSRGWRSTELYGVWTRCRIIKCNKFKDCVQRDKLTAIATTSEPSSEKSMLSEGCPITGELLASGLRGTWNDQCNWKTALHSLPCPFYRP